MNRLGRLAVPLALGLMLVGLAILGLLYANRTVSGTSLHVWVIEPSQDRHVNLTEETFATLPPVAQEAFQEAMAKGSALRPIRGSEVDEVFRILSPLSDLDRTTKVAFRGAYLEYAIRVHD